MKLSIITINRNNATGLQRTIESVVSQSFKEFEYIIIDGGSTDGSIAIIDQHIDSITYRVSEPDKGIYNAMNKGLKKATGEYIMFLNSGDSLFDNDTLMKFSDQLDGTDIVYGDFIMLYGDGKTALVKNDKPITYISFLERERFLCHQAVLMSRKSINNAGGGFDESLKIVADWKLFAIALLKQDATFKYVPVTISYFEAEGISLKPATLSLIKQEQQKVVKEDFPLAYNDFEKMQQVGCTFSELYNSSYIKGMLKFRKKIVGLRRK